MPLCVCVCVCVETDRRTAFWITETVQADAGAVAGYGGGRVLSCNLSRVL